MAGQPQIPRGQARAGRVDQHDDEAGPGDPGPAAPGAQAMAAAGTGARRQEEGQAEGADGQGARGRQDLQAPPQGQAQGEGQELDAPHQDEVVAPSVLHGAQEVLLEPDGP